MRSFFERLGAGSPLLPAAVYGAATVLAMLVAMVAPDAIVLALLALLLWLAAGVVLVVTVVWFRDDDWLAAGFLISITLVVSAWVSEMVAAVIVERTVAAAVAMAPAMLLAVVLRGAIGALVFGGFTALARWITRRLRRSPDRPSPPGADRDSATGSTRAGRSSGRFGIGG